MISFASIFNDGGPFAPDTPLRGKAERARRTLQELGAALQSQLIDMGVAFEPRFQEFQREVRAEIKSGLTSFEASMRPAIEELKRDLHSTVEQKLEPLARELRQEVQAQFALLQKNSEPAIEPIKRVLTPRLKAIDHQYKPTLQRLKAQAAQRLARLDERYQQLFKEHVDPVLGNAARSELQSMLNDEGAVLRPEERMANRRLGMGAAAFGLALTGSLVYAPATSLAIVVGLMASSAKYPHAWREWKANKRLGAVHLICVYSLYLWLGGYASAGALGAVLYGLMLKARAIGENQSRNNLVALFQLQPDSVWVRVDGQELEIPFAELRVGDVLVVRAGQVIPVDGSVIAGEAAVDQHMLTGESQPVEKSAGDAVLASTLLISGRLDVAVEKTSAETTAGQIAAILNRTAQNTRPPAVSAVAAADRLAVPTLLASLASMPFLGVDGAVCLIGANTTTASYLSGSLAMLNYLNIAARRRILVKEAKSLENLGKVDTVVFDKTGTLTMEQPKVAKVHVFNHLDEQVVLTLAAAAEARQSHPIARAILAAAAEQGLALPVVDDAHYEVGYGIRVRLAGSNDHADHPLVRVGSARFMQREGLELPAQVQALSAVCQVSGHSVVMVAVDRELIGCVELQPSLRPEAQTVIDSLRERGLALYICSGDQDVPTQRLAEQLGMTGYFANVLPEGKATLVERLQAEGQRVCFIGDGINDAIAMRQADVSISLRGATTVATDTAEIILMDGALDQLLQLFALASEFERNLALNIRYTTGISVVAVTGILFGGFSFFATEVLYSVALFGGLGIALKPLLDHRLDGEPQAAPARPAARFTTGAAR